MDKKKSRETWDRRYCIGETHCAGKESGTDPIDYFNHPFLYGESVTKRLTGRADVDHMRLFADEHLIPPARKMLAVGSGLAEREEHLLRHGYVERAVIFEESGAAVEKAGSRFAAAGLDDRVEWRNEPLAEAKLAPGEFDLVYARASLHHLYDIEESFALFHRVLKPHGLIVYDEFVGPDLLQYEDDVLAMLDEINDCLAPELRWDCLRKQTREEVPVASIEWTNKTDPSEGVHASMILPLTYRYFDVVHRVDYGGTVMRPFFPGIVLNFDFDDPKDRTIARLIMKMEEMLIREGKMPSYHSFVVGERRERPLTDEELGDCSRINYADWEGFSRFGPMTEVPMVPEHCAADHCDENWTNGVAKWGEPVIFVHATRRALRDIATGRVVRFKDGSLRSIVEVKEVGDTLIIRFDGPLLDVDVAGFPNRFALLDKA